MSQKKRAHPRRPAASGYTLLEMIASAAILSVLMAAMASAMLLIGRSETTTRAAASFQHVHEVHTLLTNELAYATSVTELTPTAVTFTVPDRDGNGSAETIRYAWAGVGQPLHRIYNGVAATLLESPQQFALSFNKFPYTTIKTTTTTTTTPEQVVASFIDFTSGTITSKTIDVSSTKHLSEMFELDSSLLPPGTKSVTLTRVELFLKGVAGGGATHVEIRKAVGGGNPQPSSNVIGTATTVTAASLPTTWAWHNVPLSNIPVSLNGQAQYCIVLRGATATAGSNVQYRYNAKGPKDNLIMMWSTDSGASWLPNPSTQSEQDMKFNLYATCYIENTTHETITSYGLSSVGVTLQGTDDPQTSLASSVAILNKPTVAGP